ncbi:MAG: competence/damage-inducible protein A [Alphaproteobacteria bacterium]|nr:MAG: competence/damage-inducible protein A [Alphaproteobacteria bacterium]
MTITSAILVVGNEILSGSTQDANIAFIAKRLAARGIQLSEVRIVRDDEAQIIGALNELRAKYRYVFTTGGIGPTHDDITAECIAKAFCVPHVVNAEAKQRLEEYYATRGVSLNEARLRMATIPEGAKLIDNPVTIAPGFNIGNVFVMAGVPKIMQGMFDHVDTLIEGGKPVLSKALRCNLREGDIAAELGAIQKEFPEVDIGSYPHMFQTPSLSLVLRSADEEHLEAAAGKVAAMIHAHGEEPQ